MKFIGMKLNKNSSLPNENIFVTFFAFILWHQQFNWYIIGLTINRIDMMPRQNISANISKCSVTKNQLLVFHKNFGLNLEPNPFSYVELLANISNIRFMQFNFKQMHRFFRRSSATCLSAPTAILGQKTTVFAPNISLSKINDPLQQ
jgi:hypothetical protein